MNTLTIAYGRKGGPRSGHIREGRRGVANPTFTVRVNETPALRLNTDHGVRFPPEQISLVPTNRDKLEYLRLEIAGALDLFAPFQRSFLDRYFAFIADRCRAVEPDLAKRVAWSGGLFRADDFVFSALWPLPNATVILSSDDGERVLGDFDFVFWDGRRLVAVTLCGRAGGRDGPGDLSGGAAPDPLMPVTIVAEELNREPGPFAEPRFPGAFVSYWIGERVPSSPFRPDGLLVPVHAMR